MKKTHVVLQILGELIEKGVLTVEALRDSTNIPNQELTYILQDLQFLNIVNVRKGRVHLSSQAYSLLFDSIITFKGLERYIDRYFHKKALREIGTIPGLLVPILLLRAATPYLGLILRDLDKNGEIQIDRNNMEFLLQYFSRRKVDYSSLENWKHIDFDIDEFYKIWITLNRELAKRVKIKRALELTKPPRKREKPKEIKRPIQKVAVTSPSETTLDSGVNAKDKVFGIPEKSLKALFGISEERIDMVQIKRTQAPIPSNLRKIREIQISLPRMLKFVQEHKSKTRGLVITIHENALSWEFTGERIKVPTTFLLQDGIYIDEQPAKEFSELNISDQVRYLEDCIEDSKRLYGSSEK